MIGVIVTFRDGNDFSEERVGKIAETARPRFEGMPGLRSKAFTFDPAKRDATNFFVTGIQRMQHESSLRNKR